MSTFAVTGMTCDGCRRKVEMALKVFAPDIAVTLLPPVAVTSAALDAQTVNAALGKIGDYRISESAHGDQAAESWIAAYYPLFLVIALIAIASFAAGSWMMAFMGGFYAVFGAFKLLDIPAFATAYARYDVIARRFKLWGYVYPVIETALGFAFLFHVHMMAITWVALVLSVIGAVGVIQATLSKQTIQCACLGTVFHLPMSAVTVVENVGMAAMAAWMIFTGFM